MIGCQFLVLGWINRTVNRSRYLRRRHLLRLPAGLLNLGDYGLLETVQYWREKLPDNDFIVVQALTDSAARADAIDVNDVEVSRHVQWMREPYGVPDTERPPGLNAAVLLSEQREFADSVSSPGLQLADMLAAILRRAFNNCLQPQGWARFGHLVIADSSTPFLQLGPPDSRGQALSGQQIEKVWRTLKSGNKQMLLRQST